MSYKNLLCLSLAAFVGACSTASVRVMPGSDGTHQVIARDIQREGAEEATVDSAREYCEARGKEAVFVNNDNNSKYTGKMDEETRNTVRNASQAAMMVGGMAGGLHNTGAGAILGGAGMVGHSMTNDRDYEAKVLFQCR